MLVHGFPGSPLDFVGLAKAMASGSDEFWVLSAPGHGGAPAPGSAWGLEHEPHETRHASVARPVVPDTRWRFKLPQYTDWLRSFLRRPELASRRVVIVAHSVGAEIVANVLAPPTGADDPELPRVNELVLLNPWLPSLCAARVPWSSRDMLSFLLPASVVANYGPAAGDGAFGQMFFDDASEVAASYRQQQDRLTICRDCRRYFPEFVALVQATNAEQYRVAGVHGYTASRRAAVKQWLGDPNDPASPTTERPRCLLIQSRHDRLFGPEYSAEVGESVVGGWQLQDRDAIVLSRSSHMVQVERADDIAEIISRWLDGNR